MHGFEKKKKHFMTILNIYFFQKEMLIFWLFKKFK